jgi:NTE family protein
MQEPRQDRPGEAPTTAVVMSGGGARAAYQVGFLRCLAREMPDVALPILTGVSAGAINAAYLAAHTEPFARKAEDLARHWSELHVEDVFEVQGYSLLKNLLRVGTKLVSGGAIKHPIPRALVDTAPLEGLLTRLLGTEDGSLPGIARNHASGELRAVALTAAGYTAGRSVTWVQGTNPATWERAHRVSRPAELTVRHVMASAALPVFFPAIEVEGRWYGDGGMRLTAPLSPAVHLGADRILAISTRYAKQPHEQDGPVGDDYPPPALIIGNVFNAIFLDLFDGDALRLERINELIRALPPERRNGMRPIGLLVLRPSRDLGQLANDYEAALPGSFRFLTRGLGTQEVRSNDLLSMVMFQPDYLSRLIELGEADAAARRDEIHAFLGAPSGLVEGPPRH